MLGKAYFYYFTEKRYPANCVKNDKHGIRSRNCAESVDLGIIVGPLQWFRTWRLKFGLP